MINDFRKRSWAFVLGSLVLPLCGCGEQTGSVKGKVYLQDKPVSGGAIAFVPPNDNKVATATIQSDGSYEIPKVSTGLAKISVTPALEVKVPAGKKMDLTKFGGDNKPKVVDEPTGKGTPIPAKYGDAKNSGLTFEVKPGAQEHDIKLQP